MIVREMKNILLQVIFKSIEGRGFGYILKAGIVP